MDYNLTLFKDSVRDVLLMQQNQQNASNLTGKKFLFSLIVSLTEKPRSYISDHFIVLLV